jgi:hypothetical protein
MKVLNYVAARAIWLFDVADLNPKGKSLFPDVLEWIKDIYHFEEAPTSLPPTTENKGLEFKKGEFQTQEEMFVNVELTIWNDGLVANSSRTTEDTDRFLADFLRNASAEFSLSFDLAMIRKRLYTSELNVRLDQSLSNLNPRLAAFAEKLSALMPDVQPFSIGSVGFWTDSTFMVTKTPPFAIERKLNAPFAENRFYTKAPVQTTQHTEMLAEFEDILAASGAR